MNKANPIPALTTSFQFIFLPSLSVKCDVAFETKLLANPGKISLAKGTATFVSTSLPKVLPMQPKFPNKLRRNSP